MLYPATYLRPGRPAGRFGGNQLSPASIGLSPLARGHGSVLHYSTPSGPPRPFRAASPCPGLDRPVSGPAAAAAGPIRTPPLARPLGRAAGVSVSLRLRGLNPLDSPRPRTPRLVFQNERRDPGRPPSYSPVTGVSFGGLHPLRAPADYRRRVSGSFHSPSGVLFTFPSRYLFAIGLGTYLGLGADVPQIPAGYPTDGTQARASGRPPAAYGAVTLSGGPFQGTSAVPEETAV